jgi:hypothetical protein
MGPTALKGDLTIDQIQRCQKPSASVDDDELEGLPLEPPLIEMIQKPLPGTLGFSR